MAAPLLLANETILALQGWKNGSLFPQFEPPVPLENLTTYPPNFTVYQDQPTGQSLNLSIAPNNLASLIFNANENSSLAFPILTTIFDESKFLVGLDCVHPLSGQYDTLSRALFYVLIVFSLIFRRHVWLSVAALGTAMTYAATTTVHLLALVTNFDFHDHGELWNIESSKGYGDIDIYGILPILTASAIMLTPILMWSDTVRSHKAQPVVISWGILVFIGLATLMSKLVSDFDLNRIPSFAVCDSTPHCMNVLGDDWDITYNAYTDCSCIDFCGTMGPAASMRKSANLSPWLNQGWSRKVLEKSTFLGLFAINVFALFFVFVSGVFGILESHYSQEAVRNWAFRVCNGGVRNLIITFFEKGRRKRLLERFGVENEDRNTRWSAVRRFLAKSVATSFYLSAIATTIFCPAFFVTTVIANEILVQAIPVSEHSDAVGAWGTWVGAGLVLIAATIEQFNKAWKKAFFDVLAPPMQIIKYSKEDRPKAKESYKSFGDRILHFFVELASPFIHAWYSTWRTFWTAKTALSLFVRWWKRPEECSQQGKDELERAWLAEELKSPGGIPICRCSMCKRQREQKPTEAREIALGAAPKHYEDSPADHTSQTHLKQAPQASPSPSTVDEISKPSVEQTPTPLPTQTEQNAEIAQNKAEAKSRATFTRQNTDPNWGRIATPAAPTASKPLKHQTTS